MVVGLYVLIVSQGGCPNQGDGFLRDPRVDPRDNRPWVERFLQVFDPVSFAARCPTCMNEVRQGPRDENEIRRLLSEDCLYFYCDFCDCEWRPSYQELANVERLLRS